MPITKAVASSVKTPGVYLRIDLLGPSSNAGTAALRALLIAPKGSAGNITANTEVRPCFGADDVATALGSGTPGHLASKRFFRRFPLGRLDVAAPTASAGSSATGTQTFSGTATENSTIRFHIHGRIVEVSWLAGETAAQFVTRAVAAINQNSADLFVTAAADTADIDYTAKVAGPWGNDVRIFVAVYTGGGGITISANPAALTGGTTEPSIATVLTLVSTTEYAVIIPCLSNADAADTSSSSNAERLANHINTFSTGLGALLQKGVVGITGSTANAKAGAIDRNNERVWYPLGRVWDDLPCEIAATEAGEALARASVRANYNRIGTVYDDLYGPRDVVANRLSAAETEDLLNNGVTPLDVDPLTGQRYLVAPITTHSTSGGAPDYRAYHLSDVFAMDAVFGGLRTALKQEFPNASITEDLPPGSDELPAGVIERRDVLAFAIRYLRGWARDGVVSRTKLDAAIEAQELQVLIDDVDPSQVNIFVPTGIIKPLSKFGVVGSKVA